ncbi:uncharacterized protein C3orf22 homolog [Manis pentadactyla]|uniref:uncharacterized protein C3orf22 homolog n=1 Tax=Manis pentadactyla TaxID=143292 RepID=UPI001874D025|nr:uncharacterized protein C3orf22 homolog [Manis pentadactyla]
MDSKAPKKYYQYKSRNKSQEKFARKFPYRFSWLTERDPESLQPWTGMKTDSSLQKQLPLQKMLVPTRSIPIRGFGAPDFTSLFCFHPPPPSPPKSLWELRLLRHSFPRAGRQCSPALQGPPLAPVRAATLSATQTLGSGRRGLPSGQRGTSEVGTALKGLPSPQRPHRANKPGRFKSHLFLD